MLLFLGSSVRGVKDPELVRSTMQHQGISTTMHRENSLILHGRGHIPGVFHCALNIRMKETLFRRSV